VCSRGKKTLQAEQIKVWVRKQSLRPLGEGYISKGGGREEGFNKGKGGEKNSPDLKEGSWISLSRRILNSQQRGPTVWKKELPAG